MTVAEVRLTHCLCDSCADCWSGASCRILSQDKADVTTLKISEVDMDPPNLLMTNEDEYMPYFSGRCRPNHSLTKTTWMLHVTCSVFH